MIDLTKEAIDSQTGILDSQFKSKINLLFPDLDISNKHDEAETDAKKLAKHLKLGSGLINPRYVEIELIDGLKTVRLKNKLTDNTVWIQGQSPETALIDFISIQDIIKQNKNIHNLHLNIAPLYPEEVKKQDMERFYNDNSFDIFQQMNNENLSNHSFKDRFTKTEMSPMVDHYILNKENFVLHQNTLYSIRKEQPFQFDFIANTMLSYYADNEEEESEMYLSNLVDEELLNLWTLSFNLQNIEDLYNNSKCLQQLNLLEYLIKSIDSGCVKCKGESSYINSITDLIALDRLTGYYNYKPDLVYKNLLLSLSKKRDKNNIVVIEEQFVSDLIKKVLEGFRQERITDSNFYEFNRKNYLKSMVKRLAEDEANEINIIGKRNIITTVLEVEEMDLNKQYETMGDEINRSYDQIREDYKVIGMYDDKLRGDIGEDLMKDECYALDVAFEGDFEFAEQTKKDNYTDFLNRQLNRKESETVAEEHVEPKKKKLKLKRRR